jgi:BirA family transcriptional regulator, biotin operon repressor / biotin---[acetyl-CoA-carboxylase] ligase
VITGNVDQTRVVIPRPWKIHRFETIDSTNRWLAEQAVAGAPDRTVAIAGEQTEGRGRLGRSWTAPPGSALLMSGLVRPSELLWPVERWHLLTFAMAEAARRSVVGLGGMTATIKWPNDLLAIRPDGAERKLAGILAEAVHGLHPGVVVGIGCNVVRPATLPDDVAARGVWLDELGVVIAPHEFAEIVLAELAPLIEAGPLAVLSQVRAACSTLGRTVRVELPAGEIRGVATSIGDDGALHVNDGTTVHVLTVGDVVHVRA